MLFLRDVDPNLGSVLEDFCKGSKELDAFLLGAVHLDADSLQSIIDNPAAAGHALHVPHDANIDP